MKQVVRYRWWGYFAFFLLAFSVLNGMFETNGGDVEIFWVLVPMGAALPTAVVAGAVATWLKRSGRLERDDNWLQER